MKAIEEVQTAGPGTECIPEDLACFLGCLTDNGDTDQIENLINSLDDESLVYKMQCGVSTTIEFNEFKALGKTTKTNSQYFETPINLLQNIFC